MTRLAPDERDVAARLGDLARPVRLGAGGTGRPCGRRDHASQGEGDGP